MPSTLDVTSSPSDSLVCISQSQRFLLEMVAYRAFSTNNDLLRALCESLAKQLASLYTRTHSSRATSPIARTTVVLDELHVLEAVGVDDERPKAGRATPELLLARSALSGKETMLT
jgi:hypothetical protein